MLVGCITLWQSYRLPSLGLAWTLDEGRVTVIEPGGPADGLLRLNDRLLTLNGLSFVGGGDMQALIHAVRPGHPAQLRIERDGAEHTVTIIPAVMPPSLEGHLIDYVAGVLLCLVGLYVLVNQRSSLTARLFLLFSMLAAAVMWGNNSLFIDPGYAAVRRLAMSVIAPCLFVSLVISLPYDRLAAGPLRGPRRAYCLLSLLLGIAGAISALFMTNWSYELYLLILANQPLGVVVASYLTIRVYRQLPPGADRDRYRTAVAVFVAGLLPSAVAVGLGFSRAWLNYDVRIVTISTFTIPVALAYVVARYRFLGARMLARQGTALALLLGTTLAILAGIYLLAFYAIDPFIPQQAPELALLVAAIVTAALFEPLRRRIWRLVTHTLNARRRELYEALGAFSHDLITLQDLSALLQALTHRLQALFPSTCLVIILRQDERQYHVAQAVGCPHVNPGLVFSPQDPLGQWLLQDQGLFASQRPLDTRALAPAEQRLINDVQPEIIIALPAREGMPLGWLVLGPQSGRSGYDTWEIDLLTSLTNQASVAIANAQLYDQTARMVRELQETNRQLEALQETSVSLTQRLALADAAQHVVQGVLSTRSYSMALLGVANEAQTAIDIVAYADADPARHAQLQEVFGASGQGAQLDLLGPANLAIQAIRQRRVLKTQDSRGIAGPTWGFDAAGNPARSDRGEQISQRQTYVLAPL
ncbi:MAG: PDZ domain-containing protein, partial [Chloroflexi bacterium]|nr:PDZ domain-containing protein [Chloroflexota bacterium]